VEALFNLAWVALSMALFAERCTRKWAIMKAPALPSIAFHLGTLALIAFLQPPEFSLAESLQSPPTLANTGHLFRGAPVQFDHHSPASPVVQDYRKVVVSTPPPYV
jgi:hypothetical protein